MCHARYLDNRSVDRSVESARAQDPALRVSDREREDVVALLREHGAAGRLDVEELEERVGAAYAAKTRGDLTTLLRDLPGEPRRRAPSPAPLTAHGGHGWPAFVTVTLVLVVIWATSGAGHFWPGWVMLWWGLALVAKTAPGLLRMR